MMTLTSPACPVAGSLPGEVEMKIKQLSGVNDAKVEITFDPPWTRVDVGSSSIGTWFYVNAFVKRNSKSETLNSKSQHRPSKISTS